MKKVLIITYYWPPSGGAGVQRWLKFTKYLPEFGWEPVILTVKNGTYPTTDPTLEKEIPPNIKIYKTKTVEPFAIYNSLLFKKRKSSVSTGLTGIKNSKNPIKKWAQYIRANYMIPDARKGWNKYAIRKAAQIIDQENIDVIVTTGPPHSSHLIGLELQKKTNIPWVSDLRDPWTTVYYNKMLPRTEKTKKRDQAIENKVLSATDCITVVGESFKDEFPDHSHKMKVVYNGFDETDINEVSEQNKNSKFTLAYIGNLKPNQSLPILWKVIEDLILENEEFKQSFNLQFVGAIDNQERSYLEKNLSENIDIVGFVSHDEAVQKMQEASLLLFVIPNIDNNSLIITGKIFEYLASGSELLSIGPKNGNAAQIIKECDRTPMIDYEDYDQLKKCLSEQFKHWLENDKKKKTIHSDALQTYTRRNQTKNLSAILDQLK